MANKIIKESFDKTQYFGSKETCKMLNIHPRTLYLWEEKGIIDTIRNSERGKRYYDVKKYLRSQGLECENLKTSDIKTSKEKDIELQKRIKICYARVSSVSQYNELEKQKLELMAKYPTYELIEDIGSGMNLSRKGLIKIIDLAMDGRIEELIITNKEKLVKIGYELIEHIIVNRSKGKIIILNQKEDLEPEEEIVKDILQIMSIFINKINNKKQL